MAGRWLKWLGGGKCRPVPTSVGRTLVMGYKDYIHRGSSTLVPVSWVIEEYGIYLGIIGSRVVSWYHGQYSIGQ